MGRRRTGFEVVVKFRNRYLRLATGLPSVDAALEAGVSLREGRLHDRDALSILDVATGECRPLDSFPVGVGKAAPRPIEPKQTAPPPSVAGGRSPAEEIAGAPERAANLRQHRERIAELRALMRDTTQLAKSLSDTVLESRRTRIAG